jgi:hypothetical protein
MDPNTQMTQEDFLTELTELSQSFGLYGENDNLVLMEFTYIPNQKCIYARGIILKGIVLISTNIWTGSSTG